MNCRTFAKILYDYQDGALSEAERVEFERHRLTCEQCAAFVESEAETRNAVREAARKACEGLGSAVIRFTGAAPRRPSRLVPLAGWRIPAGVAALLILVLLLPMTVRRFLPEGQNMAQLRDSWAEEIEVTYETGLPAETTLISHDSGVTSIIEMRVSYQQ